MDFHYEFRNWHAHWTCSARIYSNGAWHCIPNTDAPETQVFYVVVICLLKFFFMDYCHCWCILIFDPLKYYYWNSAFIGFFTLICQRFVSLATFLLYRKCAAMVEWTRVAFTATYMLLFRQIIFWLYWRCEFSLYQLNMNQWKIGYCNEIVQLVFSQNFAGRYIKFRDSILPFSISFHLSVCRWHRTKPKLSMKVAHNILERAVTSTLPYYSVDWAHSSEWFVS